MNMLMGKIKTMVKPLESTGMFNEDIKALVNLVDYDITVSKLPKKYLCHSNVHVYTPLPIYSTVSMISQYRPIFQSGCYFNLNVRDKVQQAGHCCETLFIVGPASP